MTHYHTKKQEARQKASRYSQQLTQTICRSIQGSEAGNPTEKGQPIKLSETAAETILKACGASGIPPNRKPSQATSPEERARRQILLSRRVARAVGAGYSGHQLSQELAGQTQYQAQVTFTPLGLKRLAEKIT